MKIKPLGFYVLIEVEVVEDISEGGIYLGDVKRQQEAWEFGIVRGVGPTAYSGMPGCDDNGDAGGLLGNELWGFGIGDKVEYRRYEGKLSNHPDMKNFRYIPDTHIIGLIVEE